MNIYDILFTSPSEVVMMFYLYGYCKNLLKIQVVPLAYQALDCASLGYFYSKEKYKFLTNEWEATYFIWAIISLDIPYLLGLFLFIISVLIFSDSSDHNL